MLMRFVLHTYDLKVNLLSSTLHKYFTSLFNCKGFQLIVGGLNLFICSFVRSGLTKSSVSLPHYSMNVQSLVFEYNFLNDIFSDILLFVDEYLIRIEDELTLIVFSLKTV